MKNFTIFPQNKNVTQIKNAAKYAHKKGQFKTRSAALNSISHQICKMPFNKAVSHYEEVSPFYLDTCKILMIPFKNEDGTFHVVSVYENKVSLSPEFELHFPEYMEFHKPEFKDIERVNENEWVFELYNDTNSCSKDYLLVKRNEDGILAEIIVHEPNESNQIEVMSLDSNFALNDELVTIHKMLPYKAIENGLAGIETVKDGMISDLILSILINTTDESSVVKFATFQDKEISLCSMTNFINSVKRKVYKGEDSLNVINHGYLSIDEFKSVLNGDYVKDWELNNNPYFTLFDIEENEILTDFFELNLDLNQNNWG